MEKRKGSRRCSEVSQETRNKLNQGTLETASITELFVMDLAELYRVVFPKHKADLSGLDAEIGIVTRMQNAAKLALSSSKSPTAVFERLAIHDSDTVRGWAAYVLAGTPGLSIEQLLSKIRPLADDAHFGVREWAWLAIRPNLVAELTTTLKTLQSWVSEPSENLRRFATEVTRPRGVWCSRIRTLEQQPELAIELLEPLRADPAKYVQNSVANWLNDAGKSQPAWVRELCDRWQKESDSKATLYICKRATRNLKKQPTPESEDENPDS
jgi:3-methyladenine DNA glycosylase AlkC